MAEAGNLELAREILTRERETLLTTPAARAGDDLISLLETELREIMYRMGSIHLYGQYGRAYALAGMSSHSLQRATTRGDTTSSFLSDGLGAKSSFTFSTGGASFCTGRFVASPQSLPIGAFQQQQQQRLSTGSVPFASAASLSAPVGSYETSSMVRMVEKSKSLGTGI